jgi:hypothetical protein
MDAQLMEQPLDFFKGESLDIFCGLNRIFPGQFFGLATKFGGA